MTLRPFTCTLAIAAGLCAPLLGSGAARAQSGCTTDADCPEGMTCEVVGATACAVPACPEGEDCPEPEPCESELITECVAPACVVDSDCGKGMVCRVTTVSECTAVDCAEGEVCPEPTCIDREYAECVPAPCTDDADCPEGLVCVTFTSEVCEGVAIACAPGEVCEVPEPVCEEQTESICAPPYVGPCEVDADCGEGFLCVEEEICTCIGSIGVGEPGSADASAGGASGAAEDPAVPEPLPEPVPEEDCTCELTGEKICELQQLPCTSAADCPDGWSCVGGATSICVAADGTEVECDPVESEMYCVPPDWGATFGGSAQGEAGTVSRDEPEAPAEDLSSTEVEGEASDGAAAEGDDLAADGDGSDADGDSSEPAGSSRSAAAPSDSSGDDGGCSLVSSPPRSDAAPWLLGLLGLGLLGRRRVR